MAEDRDNKTEPATPKRKEEARKQGQVAVSRYVSTAAVLLGGVGLLGSMLPAGLQKMTEMTRQGLTLPFPGAWYREISIDQVYTILIQTGVTVGMLSFPIVPELLCWEVWPACCRRVCCGKRPPLNSIGVESIRPKGSHVWPLCVPSWSS